MKTSTPAGPEKAVTARFRKVAECLYRYEPSGVYYVIAKRRGKQFRRSLKTNDRPLAMRRLAEFRARIGSMGGAKASSPVGFDALAEQWLRSVQGRLKPSSAQRRVTSVIQLRRFFGGKVARNITPRECDEWASARGCRVAASTFNNERETLRAIFELGRRDGLLLDNPASHLRRRKLQRREMVIPSRAQFARLVEIIRGLDCRAWAGADLVELLAYSGMRQGEAVALTWGHIDFERGSFVVTGGDRGTKNHEARTVPLFPGLRSLLERLRGEAVPGADASVVAIRDAKKAIASACRKAGLPHYSHHTFRHYFVSNAIEAGVDFKTIAAWVGHKDGGLLVAKTYGHLRDVHSFEMARRMTFTADGTAGKG